ncbi:hypothetical protein BDW02DRAFT_500548 [Decorospora gaudefroyi]|uniref:C2H2-type domain-containing protein n=1 Tax=Decorospora gaudefroyi TaxID=184978 RepID=A0A6A5KCB4_9PLEO|nr:hypothetical protein BDW02DRAFT_500548 [Decorospora gaudefroyi]
MNGKFKCNRANCEHKTFNRPAELKRHHNTTHSVKKPEFWCPVSRCERSAHVRMKSFPRKDKLKDHVRLMHSEERHASGGVGSV